MVSFSDLKDADLDKFSTAAAAYGDLSDQVSERLSKIHRQGQAIGDAYESEGGSAAVDAINVERDALSTGQGSSASIQTALETLSEAISDAQDDLEGAIEKATEADETAESEISGIEVVTETGGQKPSTLPQSDWPPEKVNEWWEGLSAEERQWIYWFFEGFDLHGTDPGDNVYSPYTATDPGFGGQTFTSDEGGHSGFWNEGNIARDHMALVVTGNGDEVTPREPERIPPPAPTA